MITARTLQIKSIADEEGIDPSEMGKAEKALSSLGVTIRGTNGDLRNIDDILKDVAVQWKGLTEEEQQYVSESMAGNRQRSSFVAIMESMTKQQDLYNKALGSEGALYTANEKYVESIEAKLNTLKATMQTLWTSFIDSDTIKAFVDGFTSMINVVGWVTDKIGILPTVILGIGGALGGFNKKFQEFMQGFQPATMTRWIDSLEKTKLALQAQREGIVKNIGLTREKIKADQLAGVSTKGLTTQLAGLQGALAWTNIKMALTTVATTALKMAMGMVLVGAVMAGVSALGKMIDSLIITKKEILENNEALDEFAKNQISSMKSLKESFEEINDLKSEINTTNNEKEKIKLTEELIVLQNKLADTFPDLISGYDEQGNAILQGNEALEARLMLMREEAKVKARQFLDNNKDNSLNSMGDDYKKYKQGLDKGSYSQSYTSNINGKETTQTIKVEINKSDAVKQLKELQTKAEQARTQINMLKASGVSDETIMSEFGGLYNAVSEYDSAVAEANTNTKALADEGMNSLGSGMADATLQAQKLQAEINKLNGTFNETDKQLQLVSTAMDEYNKYGGLTTGTISSLAESGMLDLVANQSTMMEKLKQKEGELLKQRQKSYEDMVKTAVNGENAVVNVTTQGVNNKSKVLTKGENDNNKVVQEGSQTKANIYASLGNTIGQVSSQLMNGMKNAYGIDVSNFTEAQREKLRVMGESMTKIGKTWFKAEEGQNSFFGGLAKSFGQVNLELGKMIEDSLSSYYQGIEIDIPKIDPPDIITPPSNKGNSDKDKKKKEAEKKKKEAEERRKKELEEERKAMENITSMRDKIISALQKKYEKQRKKELDAIDKEIDKIESKYDKLIKAQQDKLDKLNNGGVTDAEKIKALKEELKQWQQNDSALSKEKQKELEKEIAILETEQEIKNLEDKKDKELQEQEKKKTDTEKKYDKLLEEQNIYNEANKLLTTKNYKAITKLLKEYGEEWKDIARLTGKSVTKIIDDQVKKLQSSKKLIDSKNKKNDKGSNSSSNGGLTNKNDTKPPSKKPASFKRGQRVKMKRDTGLMYNASTGDKNKGSWKKGGFKNGETLYIVTEGSGRVGLAKKKTDKKSLGWINKTNITPYKIGGVVPNDSLIYAHKNERVLTKEQTESFEKLVNNILPIIKNISMSGITKNIQSQEKVVNEDNSVNSVEFNNTFNITSNSPETKKITNDIGKVIKKEAKKAGLRVK